MDINLLLPFILKEPGTEVNDTPKTHIEDPSIEDHTIHTEEDGISIPL